MRGIGKILKSQSWSAGGRRRKGKVTRWFPRNFYYITFLQLIKFNDMLLHTNFSDFPSYPRLFTHTRWVGEQSTHAYSAAANEQMMNTKRINYLIKMISSFGHKIMFSPFLPARLSCSPPLCIWCKVRDYPSFVCHFIQSVRISFILINHYVISYGFTSLLKTTNMIYFLLSLRQSIL